MKYWVVLMPVLFALFGCEKEELPVTPAASQAITAAMGDDYSNMLYFNINSGIFVKQGPHTGYDLQLESAEDGRYIFLNGSNFMFVRAAGTVPFTSVIDTSGIAPWRYDFPTGQQQRTAIGTWFTPQGTSKEEVFIVNRGYDEKGKELGFLKMQVLGVTATAYQLRIGTLENTLDTVVSINKNEDVNRVQFSFSSFGVEDIEPNKNDWHLHFTQYTDFDITDDGDTIPYLVRGVLINPENVSVARLDNADFTAITEADVLNLNYSTDQNAIGYNWKAFSLDTGIYEVRPGIVYILREKSGNYYKLRFVDYYNDAGLKGFAKFEIRGL